MPMIEQKEWDKIVTAVQHMSRAQNSLKEATTLLGSVSLDEQPKPPAPAPEVGSEKFESITQAAPANAISAYRFIPWGKQCLALHPQFIDGLFWIESEIGLKPEELVPCMKFESNIDPKARNPQSSASGLIQFMSATAVSLGTTIEAIRAMDAMQQLGMVYRYFKNQRSNWRGMTADDVYMAILWPKAVGKPMDYYVFSRGTSAYGVNKGLDKDHDGIVTKAEACAKVLALQKEGLKEENVLKISTRDLEGK